MWVANGWCERVSDLLCTIPLHRPTCILQTESQNLKEKEKKKPGSRLYEYLHIINIKIPATLNPMSHDNYSVTVLWLKVCIIVFGCVPARMSAFA